MADIVRLPSYIRDIAKGFPGFVNYAQNLVRNRGTRVFSDIMKMKDAYGALGRVDIINANHASNMPHRREYLIRVGGDDVQRSNVIDPEAKVDDPEIIPLRGSGEMYYMPEASMILSAVGNRCAGSGNCAPVAFWGMHEGTKTYDDVQRDLQIVDFKYRKEKVEETGRGELSVHNPVEGLDLDSIHRYGKVFGMHVDPVILGTDSEPGALLNKGDYMHHLNQLMSSFPESLINVKGHIFQVKNGLPVGQARYDTPALTRKDNRRIGSIMFSLGGTRETQLPPEYYAVVPEMLRKAQEESYRNEARVLTDSSFLRDYDPKLDPHFRAGFNSYLDYEIDQM